MTDYQFFVTNGEKQRVNQVARSHAMRTALQVRSEGLPVKVQPPSQISQKTIKSKATLNGRFRLGRQKSHVKSSGITGPMQNTKIDLAVDSWAMNKSQDAPDPHEQDRAIIIHSPAGFDVYYVTLQHNEQTDALFKYCLAYFQRHAKTSSLEKTDLALSMTDPLIMASVLAMTGLYCSRDGTLTDTAIVLEAWRQKGNVIRKVNYHLKSNQENITDAVIASLATLISIMNMNGVFQVADVHLNGLAQIIHIRGGFETLRHNYQLVRTVIWADIHTASGLGRSPIFPLFEPFWGCSILHSSSREFQSECLIQLRNIDDTAEGLINVLTILRKVAFLQNYPQVASVSPLVIEWLIDAAEHIILDHIVKNANQQSSSEVVRASFAASHVFLYCSFRDIPRGAEIIQVLVLRLRESLHNMDYLPEGGNNRQPVLWALFVGYAAGLRMDDHQDFHKNWFFVKLKTALKEKKQHGELTEELLKTHVTDFLWEDKLCREAFANISNDCGIC